MSLKVKIGIIKETKKPLDKRVPLTPDDCRHILSKYENVEIFIESSEVRCFRDSDYVNAGVVVVDVIEECDYFLGVKEVESSYLVNGGRYLFFSHTIKGQEYNMPLLQECLDKKITLIDYEVLKKSGNRIIAFGEIAGYIGAYETIRGYFLNTGITELQSASMVTKFEDLINSLKAYDNMLPKILFTGKGSVGKGVKRFLRDLDYKFVSVNNFLNADMISKCCLNIDYKDYYSYMDSFDSQLFAQMPDKFKSVLNQYLKNVPVVVFGHFHKKGNPSLLDDVVLQESKVQCIGDISCDISFPVQSTIRSTTISEPYYYYNYKKGKEVANSDENTILVMSVDNLPCEMPIEASTLFSNMFVNNVFEELLLFEDSEIVKDAIICQNGQLNTLFSYLNNYLNK